VSRLAIAIVLGLAAAARAQTAVRLVATVPLDPQVPAPLAAKLDELIGLGLAARDDLRLVQPPHAAGAHELGPVTGVKEALSKARAAYSAFRFAEAARMFDHAAVLIEEAGVPPEELASLRAARIEGAMAGVAASQEAAARASCRRLMELEPKAVLDRVRVPPKVVALCEEERAAGARVPSRPVSITSAPPLAEVLIDGVPRGTTPLALQLPEGRHFLIVRKDVGEPVRERLDVANAPLSRHIELGSESIIELERGLGARLAQRGPLPESARAAAAIGKACSAGRVVVAGVERSARGGWRLTAVVIDVAEARPVLRAVAEIDANLETAPEITAQLAGRLSFGTTRPEEPILLPDDAAAHAALQSLDYQAALFGRTPAPPTLVARTPQVIVVEKPAKRRGLYIGVGVAGAVLVAGGLALGLAFGLRPSSALPDQWMIHVPPAQ
jgi:hypothetical protein